MTTWCLWADAAHTAHFSIAAHQVAMEDAVALWSQLVMHRHSGIPAVLAAYETARRPEVERLRKQPRPAWSGLRT